MKNFIFLTFLLTSFTSSYCQKINVGFSSKEVISTEAKAETITIPVVFTGVWPTTGDSFKVSLKINGEASKGFDYTLNTEEIEIKKSDIDHNKFVVTILKDSKYDDDENIELSLMINSTIAEVDGSNDKFSIKIRDLDPSEVDTILGRINQDKDTTDVLAVLKLENNENITEYITQNSVRIKGTPQQSSNASGKSLNIEKVQVSFHEGLINEINVITKDRTTQKLETYTNVIDGKFLGIPIVKRYPISVRYQMYNQYINDYPLYKTKINSASSKYEYIKFGDVINYTPNLGRNYPPGDVDNIELDSKNKEKLITNKTSLTNYINLNIYTDFLALVKAEKGNGLVQTEASAKIHMNTINILYTNAFIFNFIEPSIRYSRFDIGYNYVAPDSSKNTINRMLLNQRSYLIAGLKSNLYKKNFRFYSSLEINGFFNINWANIRGELISNTTNQVPEYALKQVNLYSWGLEPKFSIPQYKNFGINLSYTIFAQSVFNKTRAEFSNNDWRWYSLPEVEMYYFPVTSTRNRIFLRLRSLIDNAGFEENFLQMQVGYKGEFKFNTK